MVSLLISPGPAGRCAVHAQMEIANLTRLVEQGSGLAMGEESTLNDLLRQKEDLIRERDQQVDQIMALRTELMETQEKLRCSENDKLELEGDTQGLKDSISEKKMEAEREARKKERMEKEMKELRAALDARAGDVKLKSQQIATTEEHVARLEQMVRDSRITTDKVQKEYNQLNEKVQKLHHDLEEQIHTNTQLLAENSQKQVELKVKEDEIAQIKAEAMRVNKMREQTAKKIKQLEDSRGDVEKERDALKLEISGLEHDLELKAKEMEGEKKKFDELVRERDILSKLRSQAEGATEKQLDLIKINENTKRNLEQEIQGYRMEAQRQSKQIWQLEKEREKYAVEASDAASKYMQVRAPTFAPPPGSHSMPSLALHTH